jgi:hypothetical protein
MWRFVLDNLCRAGRDYVKLVVRRLADGEPLLPDGGRMRTPKSLQKQRNTARASDTAANQNLTIAVALAAVIGLVALAGILLVG